MERYVVFIRRMDTGEEFISAHMAESGSHELVMATIKQKYPAPKYMVHTAYTEVELQDILESMNRWCGSSDNMQTIKKAETLFTNN